MPLQLGRRTAVLTGTVTVDEAEPLATWLRATGQARVDLAACDHLHTAVLQTLLAARVKVAVEPADEFLRSWVLPLLDAHRPGPADGAPGDETPGRAVPEDHADSPDAPAPEPALEEVAP